MSEMFSVISAKKQNAPIFTEARCRPSIPSPVVEKMGLIGVCVNVNRAVMKKMEGGDE